VSLTGSQRRFLRGLAHDLDPVLMIGHKGITEPVLKELDRVLEAHELVKVRLAQNAPLPVREAATELAGASGAHVAQTIGHVAILYRQATDPEARRIRLPAPRAEDDAADELDEG
jgi:RNA-binding protein